MIVKRLLIEC